ncbi:hypothetical protein FB192DRAFT_1421822 [Mucor lusitanicus]|uniref:Uncharacterized protein n=1 Tax=Mucor circinelloides f. lusitanicus TaxID=29924 RepID=A0A8H4BGB3_MUCCL|nr:hypothetical protein FB192DRAFT_1421822 [Mucor lusitanicus]
MDVFLSLSFLNKDTHIGLNTVASPSSITAERSTEQTNKKLEEISQYVGKDNIRINNTMMKHMDCTELTASDIALMKLALSKIDRVSTKTYQRKASTSTDKMGYELISIVIIQSRAPNLRHIQALKKIKSDRSKLLVEAKNCV